MGKIRAMSLFYKSIDNQLNKINKEYMTGSLEKEALYRYFVEEESIKMRILKIIPPENFVRRHSSMLGLNRKGFRIVKW